MVRRYLANNVITAKRIYRLSLVSLENGCLKSVLPFEHETANTEYVPGIIVIANRKNLKISVEVISSLIQEDAEATICAIAKLLKDESDNLMSDEPGVTLYSVDVANRLVKILI